MSSSTSFVLLVFVSVASASEPCVETVSEIYQVNSVTLDCSFTFTYSEDSVGDIMSSTTASCSGGMGNKKWVTTTITTGCSSSISIKFSVRKEWTVLTSANLNIVGSGCSCVAPTTAAPTTAAPTTAAPTTAAPTTAAPTTAAPTTEATTTPEEPQPAPEETNTKTFEAEEVFTIKKGGITKEATCQITIVYEGTSLKEGIEVDCAIDWPYNPKLASKVITRKYTLGDSNNGVFEATVKFTVRKFKKSDPSLVYTVIKSESINTDIVDPLFYPNTLWCPAENYMIWGTGSYSSIVNESPASSYADCAETCTTYETEEGSIPCFSWTFNNSTDTKLDLPSGICRLFGYMEVSGVAVTGVQSGYWKCWDSMMAKKAGD